MRKFYYIIWLVLVLGAWTQGSAQDSGQVEMSPQDAQVAAAKQAARDEVTTAIAPTIGTSLVAAFITYFLAIVTAFSILYFGAWTKFVLRQLLQTLACISPLVLLLVVYGTREESHPVFLVFVLALSIYPLIGRQLLTRVSEAKEEFQFMQAKILGHSPIGVFIEYAWPKFLPLTIPFFFLGFIYSLLMESMLSSVGLMPLPMGYTWGSLIHLGADQMLDDPWQVFYAGFAIILASLIAYACVPIVDRLLSLPKSRPN
tara:strand:+ start:2573 stop:3346 length:774 start_codon:yes stop_codon:yes gene_type:complete